MECYLHKGECKTEVTCSGPFSDMGIHQSDTGPRTKERWLDKGKQKKVHEKEREITEGE